METFIEEVIVKNLLTSMNSTELSDTDESSTSISSISSEEEQCIRRKRRRIELYVEQVVQNYDNVEFKCHFRTSRITAYKIIGLLRESLFIPRHTDGREKISAEKALLLTMWYFSNEESFREISDRFDVTLSSAHRSLRRVIKFLLSIKSSIIKWPNNAESDDITEGFFHKKGISGIIGAIDGSHIEIHKPAHDQGAYINRKGYQSLLLQGIVDNRKKFLDVYCGEPGSMHDARLLRKSNIYTKISNNPNFIGDKFLIADTAYLNLHWIITPFEDNGRLTYNQRDFNYKLSVIRVVVEHAFGLLKGRFRRLRKLDNLDINLCSEIIMSACVLHNICVDENDFIETDINDFNQPAEIAYENDLHINADKFNRQQQLFTLMYDNN